MVGSRVIGIGAAEDGDADIVGNSDATRGSGAAGGCKDAGGGRAPDSSGAAGGHHGSGGIGVVAGHGGRRSGRAIVWGGAGRGR